LPATHSLPLPRSRNLAGASKPRIASSFEVQSFLVKTARCKRFHSFSWLRSVQDSSTSSISTSVTNLLTRYGPCGACTPSTFFETWPWPFWKELGRHQRIDSHQLTLEFTAQQPIDSPDRGRDWPKGVVGVGGRISLSIEKKTAELASRCTQVPISSIFAYRRAMGRIALAPNAPRSA